MDFLFSDIYASPAVSQSITSANIDCFDQLGAYPPHSTHTRSSIQVINYSRPTDDEDIVRYLIKEQTLDGRWDRDASFIQHLTGKSLPSFSPTTDPEVLLSAIVIVTLETRFASLSTLWFGVVQKARKYLLILLANDRQQLDSLLDRIRQQL